MTSIVLNKECQSHCLPDCGSSLPSTSVDTFQLNPVIECEDPVVRREAEAELSNNIDRCMGELFKYYTSGISSHSKVLLDVP